MTVSKSKTTASARKPAARRVASARPASAKPAVKAVSPAAKPAPKSAQKSAPKSAASPVPRVVTTSAPVAVRADLKKKELTDLVVARSGIKKKDAKPVVEAMLAVLGETIASGRELNLQPLGKLRINRTEEKSNGRVIVCKLRQSSRAKPATGESLAKAAD